MLLGCNVVSFSVLPFGNLVVVPADCQLCPGDLNEALALTGFLLTLFLAFSLLHSWIDRLHEELFKLHV